MKSKQKKQYKEKGGDGGKCLRYITLGRKRQEDHDLEASQGYRMSSKQDWAEMMSQ